MRAEISGNTYIESRVAMRLKTSSTSFQPITCGTGCGVAIITKKVLLCFIDWATAVVGEADIEVTSVTLTYHGSDPIYETSAQSADGSF